jgi:hypothetical protein
MAIMVGPIVGAIAIIVGLIVVRTIAIIIGLIITTIVAVTMMVIAVVNCRERSSSPG